MLVFNYSTKEKKRMYYLQNKVQSSHKKNKLKDASLVCVICGASASGYNFGAIACESCKAFFRRNARKASVSFKE